MTRRHRPQALPFPQLMWELFRWSEVDETTAVACSDTGASFDSFSGVVTSIDDGVVTIDTVSER